MKKIILFLILIVLFSTLTGSAVWEYNDDGTLVGYWKLNGNINDSSGQGSHGTAAGGATVTNKGRFQQAYEFDGVNDQIKATTTANIVTSKFTFMNWFKSNRAGTDFDRTVVLIEDKAGQNAFQLRFDDANDGQIISTFLNASGTQKSEITANFYVKDVWVHYAVTYDGITGMKIYKNGNQVDVDSAPVGFLKNISSISFGGLSNDFNGILDELRLYNRTLIASEIRELYDETKISHSEKVYGSGDNGLLNESGLVGLWHLNGNALDSSGEGNDGTEQNGVAITNKGRFQQAYEFDGVNDFIDVNSVKDNFNRTKDFTITGWVNWLGGDRMYMLGYESSRFVFGKRNEKVHFRYTNATGSGFTIESITTFTLNEWTYITVTYESSSQTVNIYYNGNFENSGTIPITNDFDGVQLITIGSISGIGSFWNGTIDEVRVYNRSLSSSEIRELYNESLATHSEKVYGSGDLGLRNESGLVALYHLNGNALDSSGNGNDGTEQGGVAVTNKGRFQQAYEFDGVDDFIDVSDDDTLDLNVSFTLSAWVNAKEEPISNTGLIDKYQNDGNQRSWRWTLSQNEINIVLAQIGSSGDTDRSFNNCGITEFNKWTHLAVTKDVAAISYYKNGVFCDTDTTTSDTLFKTSEDVFIGFERQNEVYFNGSIDEVRIYNRSLSAEEVREVFNETKISHSEKVYGSADSI